jgi:hypothetical protein
MADGDGKARKVRKVVTLDALKTLKGAARYDAMREVIETEGDIEDECADDVFRRLCVRRTWPKRLGKHPTLSSYGRANRWNFNPLHRGDKETPDQPFQLAPSLSASSPDALYRLMHAVEPFRIVTRAKLGDYYKGGVFRFYSRDRRFMCWVGFHKHEIDLTFYCPREDLFIPSEPTWPEALRCEYKDWEAVIAKPENRVLYDEHHAAQELYNEQGVIVPWCSGRMRCKNPDGAAWMRLVVAVANTPQLIYGGNNFRV